MIAGIGLDQIGSGVVKFLVFFMANIGFWLIACGEFIVAIIVIAILVL